MSKKLIVGLGNPGKRYEHTRHNVGFILLDILAESKGLSWRKSSKFNAFIAETSDYFLIKPTTFMNKSGEAVAKLKEFYKISLDDIVVIHDDIDLALGKTKRQFGVSTAGHHGVENVVISLGSKNIWRLRIGVGRPHTQIEIEDWVLTPFSKEELNQITSINVSNLLGYK